MIRIRSVLTGVAGSPWYSNLYFLGTPGGEQDRVDAVRAFWTDYAAAFLAVGLTVRVEGEVPTINPATGDITAVLPVVPGAPINGLINGEKLPPMTQYCLNLRTGVYNAGREVRGKFFAPGFTIGHNNDQGAPTADVLTNLRANFAANLDNDPTDPLVVWSRKSGVAVPVQSVSGSDQWSFLSSRRD